MFKYKKLGKFAYPIIKDKKQINISLLDWIREEWEIDHKEFPDQQWTIEWLELLPKMNFKLEIVDLNKFNLRQDLMNYKSNS